MFRSGYCTVAGPPSIPVASAEQLEESLSFDDLLVSDNILESLELSEVLDSQAGSYLKSLGTDGDCRFPSTNCLATERPVPEFYNHFSPATRIQSYGALNVEQRIRDVDSRLLSSAPVQAYYAYSNFSPLDCARDNAFQQYRQTSGSNIECTYFSESVPSTPILLPETPTRSVSPSTFYNLPTVARSVSTVAQDAQELTEKVHGNSVIKQCASWTPASSCSRDGTASDADSGIHSPESTPSRYMSNGVALATGCIKVQGQAPALTNYCQRPVFECAPALANTIARAGWRNQESSVSMEVFTMPIEGSRERGSTFHLEAREEGWERASISSNASTLSIESEAKFLNMDDCKTYANHEVPTFLRAGGDIHQQEKCADFENDSQNSDTFTESSCPVTTVFPAFVAKVGPSTNLSNDALRADTTLDPVHRQFSESSVRNEKLLVARSNKLQSKKRAKSIGNNTATFSIDGRRRSFNGSDASFIDPYDLKIRRATGKSSHLWEFIRDTLLDPQYCPRLIKWEDRKAGIFRFVQSDVVAGMWGEKKNNPKMTYEKLSRAMRYYYNRGILERVDGRRLVYKFGRNAHGWQQFENNGNENNSRQSKQEIRKVKKEVRSNAMFPRPTSRPATKRKFSAPKIAVSVCDSVLPSLKKCRQSSRENNVPQYVSVVTSEHRARDERIQHKLDNEIAVVQKNIDAANVKIEPRDCPQKPTVSETTTAPILTSAETSCIVYVARPEPMTDKIPPEKPVNVFEAEVSSWSPEISSERQGKLPSADVLLGKQFKIATAAT